jgi:hypothetical protein
VYHLSAARELPVPEAKLDLTDELLVAYVDDELDTSQRAMVKAVLERNPALSRRADEMRLARDLLREAFPLQPDAVVPGRIDGAATHLAAACARHRRPARKASGFRYRWSHAIAAGLLLCMVAASYLVLRPASDEQRPMVTALTEIRPENPLHGVLESTASAQLVKIPGEDAAVRTVLTFQAKDGRYCREFEILSDSGSSTGIACREQGHWSTEVLASGVAVPADGNFYTPAGGSDEAAVAEVFEGLVQGEPLGVEEETRLLAAGWSPTATRAP